MLAVNTAASAGKRPKGKYESVTLTSNIYVRTIFFVEYNLAF